MKTTKKQIKVSKGEINEALLERTDLELLSSSASYINNYISTIYGGFKTRQGTIEVDDILSSLVVKETTKTSYIGGDTADFGTGFVSTTITGATNEILLDLSTSDVYENITLTNVRLSFEEATITVDDTAGVIDFVSVDISGKGYKAITVDVVGDGAGCVLSPTIATDGSITGVSITSGGSGYTSYAVEITETDIWTDAQIVEVSTDDITYTELGQIEMTRTATSYSYPVSTSYRYVRLRRDGSAITTCLELFDFIVYDSTAVEDRVRVLPFIFNEDQKYLFILTDETMRVYQDDQLLETIPAIGIKDDYFKRLKYSQAEDTMVLTHPNMKTKQIKRGVEESSTTIVPLFTVGETVSGDYTIGADSSNVYKIFDQNTATNSNRGEYFTETNDDKPLVIPTTYDYTLSNDITVDWVSETNIKRLSFLVGDIEEYKIYTKDFGGTYTLQETKVFIIPEPYVSETRTITSILDIDCYGIKIETTGVKVITEESFMGHNPTVTSEWYPTKCYDVRIYSAVTTLFTVEDFPFKNIPYYHFGNKDETDKTTGLTPTASEGAVELTADSGIFSSAWVGQYINTALGSRFKITSYISSTKVSGYTVVPFLNTNKITKWTYESGYEPVWSEDRGWGNACLFYQQRLWIGGSKGRPQTVWGSRTNNYNDFENIGAFDNDSIEAPIASKETNEIVNIFDNRGLQIFTNAEEYVANEDSLTPDNIFITKTTSNGSLSKAEPISVAGNTLFLEKNGKSLLNFVYTETEANYVTGNVSRLSSHLINNPTRLAIDYNSDRETGNYLYMSKTDGELLVTCIDLEQKINAFSRFNTNGLVKDILVLKSDVYLLVQRGVILYLEKIADVKVDGSILKGASQTVTGLDKWEDMEVRVYTKTTDYGLFTVDSGSITLPSVPTETLYIGEDFECKLTSNDLFISNETTSKYKRISRATITTLNTTDITFNGRAKSSTTDIFDYYSVSGFRRRMNYEVSSKFDRVEILSVMLYINYGGA